jgi:ribosome-associated translation inhibitor RaiA
LRSLTERFNQIPEESTMSIPVQITFRHLTPRAHLESLIHGHVARLERHFDRIVDCRVLLEMPHRRHDSGNHFRVRVELTVPQERLVVSHDADLHGTAQDLQEPDLAKRETSAPEHRFLHEALHDAFDATARRLQDYVGRQREAARPRGVGSPA